MHFMQQAIEIKKLYYKYLPSKIVIDGAGVGAGLVDELIMAQNDLNTGQFLAPFGVMNDDSGYYQ